VKREFVEPEPKELVSNPGSVAVEISNIKLEQANCNKPFDQPPF